MTKARRGFIPAAGHDWFLPLYDPFVKLLGGDSARRALIIQAALQSGHHALDIGCGTGSLAVLIKQMQPGVTVVGLDPDSKALSRARRKAVRAGVSVQFDEGFADDLPYPEAAFDRVFSSFMFHHLEPEQKDRTLQEARRVLRPGGTLHLLDFGGPRKHSVSFLSRLVHSSHRLKDNFEDRIPNLMARAGLQDPKQVDAGTMAFVHIGYYQAASP